MPKRPPMIRDKDTIEFRLTEQSESRLPFVFVETLDEATLAERSLRVYEEAARDRRLIHVLNRSTDGILGTAMVQPSSDGKRPLRAEVGGLAVHPGARGFGIASHLFKVMMVYAVKESGRDPAVHRPCRRRKRRLDCGCARRRVSVDRHRRTAPQRHRRRPEGGSFVRMESFAFDRAALDGLILDLWRFVREQQGVIARSDPAGDVRITLDFSHIISPGYLDAESARIGSSRGKTP